MDFGYSQKVFDLHDELGSFMENLVLTNNERWHREAEAGNYPLELIDEIKTHAKASGLLNLCRDFAMSNLERV
jgi:acyl-CoA dehydrogenase